MTEVFDPDKMCGLCLEEVDEFFPAPCSEKPELAEGKIGMYHCPDCGMMLLAGYFHFFMCKSCIDKIKNNN